MQLGCYTYGYSIIHFLTQYDYSNTSIKSLLELRGPLIIALQYCLFHSDQYMLPIERIEVKKFNLISISFYSSFLR